MEIIRNYLDAMFAGMPNTEAVLRARDELWQMMEDKYSELIGEGKSENEAIGTVIAEFGNLSELADVLGVGQEVSEKIKEEEASPKRHVTMEEAEAFLHAKYASAIRMSIGIALLVASIIFPISFDMIGGEVANAVGVLAMSACLAAGIVLIVISCRIMKPFTYLRKEKCSLGMDTTKYVHEEKSRLSKSCMFQRTIGIICCAACWVPAMFFSLNNSDRYSDVSGILIFAFVAAGVLLITYSAQILGGYRRLLGVNDKETVVGNYVPRSEEKIRYASPVADNLMSVYWVTVTCLYLIVSFATFRFEFTWIIWPVAAIAHRILKTNLRVESAEGGEAHE